MRLPVAIVALGLAFVAAGCGSDSPESTASAAQIQSFADQQLALRLDDNQSAEPFTCEEGDDAQHWKCTTDVTTDNADGSGEDTVELTVDVTCDETANCTYVPET